MKTVAAHCRLSFVCLVPARLSFLSPHLDSYIYLTHSRAFKRETVCVFFPLLSSIFPTLSTSPYRTFSLCACMGNTWTAKLCCKHSTAVWSACVYEREKEWVHIWADSAIAFKQVWGAQTIPGGACWCGHPSIHIHTVQAHARREHLCAFYCGVEQTRIRRQCWLFESRSMGTESDAFCLFFVVLARTVGFFLSSSAPLLLLVLLLPLLLFFLSPSQRGAFYAQVGEDTPLLGVL